MQYMNNVLSSEISKQSNDLRKSLQDQKEYQVRQYEQERQQNRERQEKYQTTYEVLKTQ